MISTNQRPTCGFHLRCRTLSAWGLCECASVLWDGVFRFECLRPFRPSAWQQPAVRSGPGKAESLARWQSLIARKDKNP